ncbi:hypothetical protein [Mycolicibacterium mageritense]|uniref:hypothetical protein n=1 Tax=Mycolicibacterium mageritense TaxID=53462 RepID=UPI001E3DC207|nr:hypothetical protein [Mycolicibacterium mageritense]GJJ23705.1 hypothetical protein MTY414_73780 [Mycolicibacterium mageritense]
MSNTPITDALANTHGHLRLWSPTAMEFLLWSNHVELTPTAGSLVEFLIEQQTKSNPQGWVLATFDYPGRGRVWSGRMRIGDNGDVEAVHESEFLTALRVDDNPLIQSPEPAGDPWSDGWVAGGWWRVILSDGSVWCETSVRSEALAGLRSIRGNAVTVYPPSHPDGKVYGPDPGATLQRRYDRSEHEWREETSTDE